MGFQLHFSENRIPKIKLNGPSVLRETSKKKKKRLTIFAIIHIENTAENFSRGRALLYWEFLS